MAASTSTSTSRTQEEEGGRGFSVELPAWLVGSVFPERELALEQLNQFASDEGFQMAIRSSTKTGTITYLSCRARTTPKCPYSVKIAPAPDRVGFVALVLLRERHNHPRHLEEQQAGSEHCAAGSAKRRRQDEQRPHRTPPPPAPAADSISASTAEPTATACPIAEPPAAASPVQASAPTPSVAAPPAEADDRVTSCEGEAMDEASSLAASCLTTRTDSSAVRRLMSLSFNAAHPPSRPPSTSTATREGRLEAAVRTVLYERPMDPTLGVVSAMQPAQARSALVWVRALAQLLEVRLQWSHPPSPDEQHNT